MAFRWWVDDGTLIVLFWYLYHSSPHQTKKNIKNRQSLTPSNKTCWIRAWACVIIPSFFLKKNEGDIVIASVRLSVRPLCSSLCPSCYLLLNHPMKFNQIWCVCYSHEWGAQQHFLAPPPGALGRGQKVKYHLISITKSISKIFVPNFVCILTNQ